MDLPLVSLFKGIKDDQFTNVNSTAKRISMKLGQKICSEGEEAKEIFVLETGAVELVTRVENNVELPVGILRNPGDVFGSGVLVAPYRYSLTARCETAGALFQIEGSELRKLMKEDRDLGCIIMTNLAEIYLNRLKESRREIKIHFNTLLKSYR